MFIFGFSRYLLQPESQPFCQTIKGPPFSSNKIERAKWYNKPPPPNEYEEEAHEDDSTKISVTKTVQITDHLK
jgi:hypothetical protein